MWRKETFWEFLKETSWSLECVYMLIAAEFKLLRSIHAATTVFFRNTKALDWPQSLKNINVSYHIV